MSKINIDLLRKDECQPYTDGQMANIKSQFHPSNTANVNIVPYHIYDEDGVEQVVGEIRKTIDGVKKCKPVYEKIVNITSPSSKNSWVNLYTMSGVVFVDIVSGYLTPSTSSIKHKLPYSIAMTLGIDNNTIKTYITEDWVLHRPTQLTLQYTKDSDEWQPV